MTRFRVSVSLRSTPTGRKINLRSAIGTRWTPEQLGERLSQSRLGAEKGFRSHALNEAGDLSASNNWVVGDHKMASTKHGFAKTRVSVPMLQSV